MAKKILLVDDDPDLLRMISFSLKKKGYEVSTGQDGREALDMASRLMPDIMLLDVNLPLINGDEVSRLCKQDEKLKHLTVILMSALREDLSEKARNSGADGLISKPFELSELFSLVQRHCPAAP